MVLPLRVWLDERVSETLPTQWAHTIEISQIGGRLGGLRMQLSPGQTITLQRGQHKAAFRVIWSRHLAANENQAGIEALDYGKTIWGVELPPSSLAKNSLEPTFSTGDSSAAVVPTPLAFAPKVSASSPSATHKSIPVAAHSRWLWGLMFGLLLFSLAVGLSVYHQIFHESGRAAIQPSVPAPPTAEDLARLTPKPHLMPASLTRTADSSASRLQVAEAPTGHVVYPVAPEDGIGGKVRLQIIIAANGLVKQVYVLSGKQPLAEAAAQAVRFWHYSSLQGSERSRERETSVTVSFLGPDAVFLEFPSAKVRARTN
jgi:TonB family protein